MKPIKKVWNMTLAMSRPVMVGLISIAVVASLFCFKLGTLTPGLSAPEITSYQSADSLGDIVNNAVNAPYKTLVFLSTRIVNSVYGLRIVSASLGMLSVSIFYLLARKLYTTWIAIGTTALFATSSLLLSVGRLGTPDIMSLALLAVIGVGFLLRFSSKPDLVWPLAAAVVSVSLYVPGMAFFVLPAIAWQFWQVRRSFEQLKPVTITICACLIGFLLAPLVISLIREPSLWRGYLGLPAEFPGLVEMVKNIGRAAGSLVAFTSFTPVHWLGRTPILDVLATVLFLYGLVAVARQYKLDRLWLFMGIFFIGLVWIGVTGYLPAVVALLPFVYLLAGFGLYHMIRQWLKVFPNNPIARSTGVIMLMTAVCLAINFQLQRYFVAWPNNNDVKATFNQQWP